MNNENIDYPTLVRTILDFLLTKEKTWINADGHLLTCNCLIYEIGLYIKEKGELWRTGEGCEINDKYQALMELIK